MNSVSATGPWLQTLGLLAAQSTLLLAIAGFAQGFVCAPQNRRRVWLAAMAALALLLVHSSAGFDRFLAGQIATNSAPESRFIVQSNLPVTAVARGLGGSDATLLPASAAEVNSSNAPEPGPVGVTWPVWLWLAGAGVVGVWAMLPRVWLALADRPVSPPNAFHLRRRVQDLAERLHIRRQVRVVCLPRLAGPVAFGVVRPSIGLPADFWTTNSAVEQDAMLAHELAHLAARDPFWLALADTLAALLWWQPLVWWARRQFRAASETAADEASLVVEDGPAVLAGCLVALASRWQRRGVLGVLGMAEFRSGLGRRVERLLRLRGGERPVLRSGWPGLLAWLGAMATLGMVVAVPARLYPAEAANRPSLLAVVGDALAQATTAPHTSTPAPNSPSAHPADSPTATVAPFDPTHSVIALTVRVPQVAGVEPKSAQVVSMDAVTRRLGALDWFGQVRCEPLDTDRFQVHLTLKPLNTAPDQPTDRLFSSDTVAKLISQSGQLEFRRVHPDSATLIEAGHCPADCEVLTQDADGADAAQRFVVFRRAAANLTSTNLAEVTVTRDALSNEPRVAITFDDVAAKAFSELTRQSIGQRVAIVLDGTVLMAPHVMDRITGGKCEISGRFSENEARALAAALAHPLSWKLTPEDLTLSGPGGDQATVESPGDPSAERLLPLLREEAAGRAPTPSQATALVHPTSPPTPPASATAPATDPPRTRTFRVEPHTLAAGLESVTGKGQPNLTAQEQVRALFALAGLDFPPVNAASPDKPSARALLYNDRNGILLVRAPMSELDIVERLLQVLTTVQPQVVIEAKFVEVAADANAALRFDWYLGHVQMGTNLPADTALGVTNGVLPGQGMSPASPPPGSVGTITGILTDPQLRELIAALEKPGTNGVRELRGDQLPWPGRDATNAANIRVTAAQGTTVTAILSDPQFRVVLRALEQRTGVDVLAAPKVTTLSGRQAQIQVADIRTVLTGLNPGSLKVPGAGAATNGPPFSSATIPTGPSLDVIPVVDADGGTIHLTVIPTVTEFLGYDEPPKNSKVVVLENGKARHVHLPLPRFRVRQMVTQAAIRDGQTLVLGGFPVEETRLAKAKVPVLGDIPLVGGLFRSESRSTVRRQLLVFVTATIIDPAGNPVHAAGPTRTEASRAAQPPTPTEAAR